MHGIRRVCWVFVSLWLLSCTEADSAIDADADRRTVLDIFAAADVQTPEGLKRYLEKVADDVVLMPHNHPVVEGKNAYAEHVKASWEYGETRIKHELIESASYDEIVVARGRAVGKFKPVGSVEILDFETKNLFVFTRSDDGGLYVSHVIFNMNP